MRHAREDVPGEWGSDTTSDCHVWRAPLPWREALAAGAVCLTAFSALAQAIDDPIAYWPFEGGASVLVNQAVSGPYHDAGVFSGQPSSGVQDGEAGLVGNALLLDGASSLRLPYHQDNLGRSFTIAMWYWQDNATNRMALYQTKDTWNISYEAIGASSTFASYVGESLAGNVTSATRTWTHLVHSFATAGNTTTLSVYTNGVLVLTKAVPAANVFENRQIRLLYLGCSRNEISDRRFFKGMIDEVALYNRALTAGEAAALYQRGLDGEPLEVTPQAWPRIDLTGKGRSFVLSADEGYTPGAYQAGWLLAGKADEPPIVLQVADTACRMADTAGHEDGPFHATLDAAPKFRVPLMPGGLGQVTEGDFTVEARFRTKETDRGIIMGNYTNLSSGYLNLEVTANDKVRMVVNKGVSSGYVNYETTVGKNIRDGAWHHVAGVRSNATIYLYVDGVEVGQTPDLAGAGSFTLGGGHYYFKGDSRVGVSTTFGGDIENARLWTRAVSAAEIGSLATNAVPGEGAVARDGMLAEYVNFYSPYHAPYANPKYKIPMVSPIPQVTLGDWTVETWFRTTDTARGILLGNYLNASTCGFNLEIMASTDNRLRLYLQNTSAKTRDLYSPAGGVGANRDGSWHHAAAMRRGSQLYLYYDGQQVGTLADTTGSFLVNTNFFLARDGRTGVTEFDGDLRNARLWSRALTTLEVAALAEGDSPGGGVVAPDNMVVDYTYFRPTNSLNTAGLPGSWLRRTYIKGSNTLSLVFANVPRHKEIGIGMLLAQLDSLNTSLMEDLFAIKIDGREALSLRLGYGSGVEAMVSDVRIFGQPADTQLIIDTLTYGGDNLYYCGTSPDDVNEHVYDLSRLEALQSIPHTDSSLTVELIGIQDEEGGFESFGVDQISLSVPPLKGTLFCIQ